MKPLLALALLGLGIAALLGAAYQDPRDAAPAAIPERFLAMADGECRQAMTDAGTRQAAAFCGCVVDWSRDNLTFRAFRALKVELDAAATGAGGDRQSYARAAAEHERLGPVIARCRAVHAL